MKNSKSSKKKVQQDEESLAEFLDRMNVKEEDWDFVIIGDGSGSNWNREAGWSAVTIEKITMERKVWNGAINFGTVNFAEMMAYLQPLNWLSTREEDRRKKHKSRRQAYHVHIFTDSQYCRDTGNSCNRMVAKNGSLWAVFDVFARQGFVLHWHWIRRGSNELNSYCDELSKLARKLIKKYNLQERLELTSSDTRTVYDINPSD